MDEWGEVNKYNKLLSLVEEQKQKEKSSRVRDQFKTSLDEQVKLSKQRKQEDVSLKKKEDQIVIQFDKDQLEKTAKEKQEIKRKMEWQKEQNDRQLMEL